MLNPSDRNIYFESYGVTIGLEISESVRITVEISEFIIKLKTALKYDYKKIDKIDVEYLFQLRNNVDNYFEIVQNGKPFHSSKTLELILGHLDTKIRVTIAEYAVGKVFLHAGVVGWKGKAIVIPGKSFQGKTTLVAELVKKGAEYFSDEYAVLDEKGFVYPFPKMLSLRGIVDDFRQTDVDVETIGGRSSRKELPVGMILITEYQSEAVWKPVELSMGKGVMELLPHTIPIRNNPEFSLNVLNKIVNRAIISKTQRGEAGVFAEIILNFFETRAF